MIKDDLQQRSKDKIAWLTRQCLDVVTFWHESSEVLKQVVPHQGGSCWYTLDPFSLLVTTHYNTVMPELPPEWYAHEYFVDNFQKLAEVARSECGISTLHEATSGNPSLSPRWNRYIRPWVANRNCSLRYAHPKERRGPC